MQQAVVAPEREPQTRFKLRFRSREAMTAALAMENASAMPVLTNERRHYVAFAPTASVQAEFANAAKRSDLLGAALDKIAKNFDAELAIDRQYDLEPELRPDFLRASVEAAQASLDDVVKAIRADEAWATSDGAGVTIAIVDTGVHGDHKEFAAAKRDGGWAVPGDDPWSDWEGHGTMCACIAAGTDRLGGKYRGVAPGAKIMSCKTHFFDTELGAIYDALTDRAKNGTRIVASNSFGLRVGAQPQPDPSSDFLPALDDAIAAGVIAVFSAGNNHELAGGNRDACSPNSIWLYKSRADLLAVATCALDRKMWFYSSRGPGQDFGSANTNRKPDVTAPTPKDGRILYGADEAVLPSGWGTSGACPQVAGLAALLISANPSIDRAEVFRRIKNAGQSVGLAYECEGSGVIDCVAAIGIA